MKNALPLAALVASLELISCSGKDSPKKGGQVLTNVVAGSSLQALRIGSPTATSLTSLKYFITGIQLCREMTISGTGFSDASGCINLYVNRNVNHGEYNNYLVTQASADTTPNRYIDLMSAEGQAALRQPFTVDASMVGAYKYGLINFFRPIKVTAEFPILGQPGQFFRTRAISGIVDVPPVDSFPLQRVLIGDTLSGDAEETTYMLNNGGTWFIFQKPFEITDADIEAQTNITLDLVFNPDSFGQAYEVGGSCDEDHSAICDPLNNVVIDMPFVRMSPVPRKAGDKTRKEIYLVDYGSGATASKLRIELYYNDSDPEKSIQGVDSAIVYEDTATQSVNNVIASTYLEQTGSVSTNDASVKLLDYLKQVNLEGLARRTNGTATITCRFTGTICTNPGEMLSRPYVYVEDVLVSQD
jgi:hypothetical protein